MTLGLRIRSLRESKKLTQKMLAEKLKIPNQNLSNYERGFRQPDYETLEKIADFFDVSTDYLLGRTQKKEMTINELPALSEKEERDIAKDLEKTLEELENSDDALMFDGEPIDEHTKEMIRISLENSMRMAKQLAKQKFTPKKYRKE
ncbi:MULTISPECIES: helix-turn-helix domain-containing protein [Bacillus cereus group]|uniref:helix-turn-helix domain-containing protein n=1 Tax=Bacillus cereus group TaxID=86661 RepID=UPI001F58AE60|nr:MULTISPECIES: helix-turn-helix transcriptional regulator [unclassified Bacillus cereus group]EMA6341720.1 helix-turn-helix transcriptional regulator [Bacillus cytotoxicus]